MAGFAAPAAEQQPPDPPCDRHDQPGDVSIAGWRQAMEAERPVRPGGEQAIEPERVKMNVELEPAPEALHDGDGAALPLRDAATPAASAVPAEHRADEHAQHGAAERVVEREAVAQAVRYGEHPLA